MSEAATGAIRVERAAGLVRVTLTRPEAGNVLGLSELVDLRERFDEAAADRDLRVLVLTGAGEAFCTGAGDAAADAAPVHAVAARDLHAAWEAVCQRLESFPGLAVARINGACEQGGLSLAMACDLRIAAAEASFGYDALGHHLLPMESDVTRMRALAGASVLRAMTLAGRRFEADAALAAGLVDAVAGRRTLDELVEEVCAPALAANAEEVVAIKRLCSKHADYAVVDLCYRAMYDKEAAAARRLRED